MLTAGDKAGRPWLIVGTRPGGDRLVIEERGTLAAAEARAGDLRAQLEGYLSIDVERAGGG